MVQLFPAKIWNGLAIINFIFFPCPPPPPTLPTLATKKRLNSPLSKITDQDIYL